MQRFFAIEGYNIKPFFEKPIIFFEQFYFWYESGIQKPFLLFSYSPFNLRGIQPTMRNNNAVFSQITLCGKLADSTCPAKRVVLTPTSNVKNTRSWVAYGN
jgi:hypothetical protein